MGRLEGKVALTTGAAAGIAKATAVAFVNPSPAARARTMLHKLYPFSVGEPEHIAALAVFLGSDESCMLTGTTIAADGGKSSSIKVSSE